MSDSSAVMSPSPVDPAKIDQQWELLKMEATEVASVFQTLVRKMQTAVDGGDTAAAGWLNDLKVLAAQVRKEQEETQSLVQLLHDFAVQSLHELAGHQSAAQAQSAPAPAPAAAPADPYAVVPDVPHAAAPAAAVDPYAVVPDVPHPTAAAAPADPYAVVPDVPHPAAAAAAVDPYAVVPDVAYVPPPKPAVDPYAVVMDRPNRDEAIPPWYTNAQAAPAAPATQPVAAAAAPAPGVSTVEEQTGVPPYAAQPAGTLPSASMEGDPMAPHSLPVGGGYQQPATDPNAAPGAMGVPAGYAQPVQVAGQVPGQGYDPSLVQQQQQQPHHHGLLGSLESAVGMGGGGGQAGYGGGQPGYGAGGQGYGAGGYGGAQAGYAPGPGGAYDPNYAAGGAYGNTQAGSTLHRFMHGSLGRGLSTEAEAMAINDVWGHIGI